MTDAPSKAPSQEESPSLAQSGFWASAEGKSIGNLLEQAGKTVVFLDLEGRILDASPHLSHLLNGPLESLRGQMLDAFFKDPGLGMSFLGQLETDGPAQNRRLHLRNPRPGAKFFLAAVQRLRQQGNLGEGFLVLLVNRTWQFESDEILHEQQEVLNHASDAIFLMNLRQEVTFWNRAAEELYGLSAEQVLGLPCPAQVLFDQGVVRHAFRQCLEGGQWSGDLRQVGAGGRHMLMQGRWSMVRDLAGEPRAILAIHTDVTERRAQRERELRTQRLESIGTMVGGLAHDLNNILHPVSMSLQLLPSETLDTQARQILETVRLSVDRAGKMIRQVLSFARGIEGERELFYVEDFLSDIEHFVRVVFPKNIHFDCQWPAVSRPLRGNPTQLFQGVLNLCTNARDAMKEGGSLCIEVANIPASTMEEKVLRLLPGRRNEAAEFVRICIRDTGPGIPPELQERIFDRFFTTKPQGAGTGLGLSTTSDILRRHGGCLHLDASTPEGTVFSLYLPVSRDRADLRAPGPPPHVEFPADAPADSLPPAPTPKIQADKVGITKIPPFSKSTLLLVDDEPAVLMVLKIALEKSGYRVLEARSGEEALEKYKDAPKAIDLVITDVAMPNMNGLELVKAIREIRPEQKCLVATGMPTPAQIEAIRAVGVREVLSKPCGSRVILETISRMLSAT